MKKTSNLVILSITLSILLSGCGINIELPFKTEQKTGPTVTEQVLVPVPDSPPPLDLNLSFGAGKMTLLPNPGDAMNHAIDIIASEFRALLDTYEVGEKANLKTIEAWIDMKSGEGASFEVEVGKGDIKSVDSAVIYELQNVGIEKAKWYNGLAKKYQKYVKNHGHEKLTQTFCAEGVDATELDYRFAILTSLKNRYRGFEYRPILTLGTIIKSESFESSNESGKFWLCVQPRCDSVRIWEARNFFFLLLEVVDGDKKFDIVLEDKENKFKKLRIHYKIYESANFKFAPDGSEEQVIRAKEENEMFVFDTTDKKP